MSSKLKLPNRSYSSHFKDRQKNKNKTFKMKKWRTTGKIIWWQNVRLFRIRICDIKQNNKHTLDLCAVEEVLYITCNLFSFIFFLFCIICEYFWRYIAIVINNWYKYSIHKHCTTRSTHGQGINAMLFMLVHVICVVRMIRIRFFLWWMTTTTAVQAPPPKSEKTLWIQCASDVYGSVFF